MRDWHHAPLHRFSESGSYIVTASTLYKVHHFRTKARLDFLLHELLTRCEANNVRLDAWAVFSNHYHFVCGCEEPERIRVAIKGLHRRTAIDVNKEDGAAGRQVWFNYRDTQLTSSTSYYARLRYVHENAVNHRLVLEASAYPWCSANWFLTNASPALQRTVASFKIDQVKVPDDFDPIMPD